MEKPGQSTYTDARPILQVSGHVNPGLDKLHQYPFERLSRLRESIKPAALSPINLSVGEPKHPTPPFILEELQQNLAETGKYPTIRGIDSLRSAIHDWLVRRYDLPLGSLDPDTQILPINGTREALFAIAHCLIDPRKPEPVVVTGNPFYQTYEGAALLAGAQPWYVNTLESGGFLPDFAGVPEQVWKNTQLLYLCSPNNPTGEVHSINDYQALFGLADRHDFIIAADECYCEIYDDEQTPPPGILQACIESGRNDFARVIAFHSLSKRSNVPGMRSGFVAGQRELLEQYYRYRTYHGCTMPLYVQNASVAAWRDEQHVIENRRLYREKFDAVLNILGPVMNIRRPPASFYLWPETPIDEVEFTRLLYSTQNVLVLPGSFNARIANNINPGDRRIRIALVAPLDECVEAAQRIRNLINTL